MMLNAMMTDIPLRMDATHDGASPHLTSITLMPLTG